MTTAHNSVPPNPNSGSNPNQNSSPKPKSELSLEPMDTPVSKTQPPALQARAPKTSNDDPERFSRHPTTARMAQEHAAAQNDKRALRFPLNVRMKLLTIAPQFYIDTVSGKPAAYLKQRAFKLKEDIQVFSDESQQTLLHRIKADRVLDFGATYHFHSAQAGIIGFTKQHGFKSMWRTSFEVGDDDGIKYTIEQANPMVEALESLLAMIPFVGAVLVLLSGYVLNPTYEVKTLNGEVVASMKRLPALFEGKFELRSHAKLPSDSQELIILALMTLLLMQRGQD